MQDNHYLYKFFATTSEAWEAMYQAILGAQKSIFWEVYIFIDDGAGARFVKALADKARAGVEVKIVIDAVGSRQFSSQSEEELRKAGAEIHRYNKLHPQWNLLKWFWRIASRNHRKVLIVDETIAFLGGVNVKEEYRDWNDLYVRLEGKLVRPLLRAFAKSYISAGGKKETVKKLIHQKKAELDEWRQTFNFMFHSSRFQRQKRAMQWYVRALAMASESVNLLTPYFVPDKRFLKALAAARRRGVKVNLYLPLRPDHKAMALLARLYYSLVEKLGATIHFLPTMNHGKAVSIDNKVGMIGSANLTRRSFWLDAESGVEFNDVAMVAELNEIFNRVAAGAESHNSSNFVKLGPLEKFQQWILKKLENYF